jgi:hypothetical protein
MRTAGHGALDQGEVAIASAFDTLAGDDLAQGMLSELERRQLCLEGCLVVESPSQPQRTYLIMAGRKPTVVVEWGREALSLWLESAKGLPVEQGVMVEKLLIEHDETRYLQLAKPSESLSMPRNDFLDNGLRNEFF